MPLTVVVGGSYGSEGKGKMVSFLAAQAADPVVVRCGGSNAGHTADACGLRIMLRQLPSGAVDPRSRLLMAAGMQLDLAVLAREMAELGIGPERLGIDPNATIIEAADQEAERAHALDARIGSTLSGTGSAVARKVMRDPGLRRAADIPALAPYLASVSAELSAALDRGADVIVEGTQGVGLSLHHGPFPYATARDTTAAGFLSEAGLPPTRVTDVVVVLRTYPIRVAGQSGPMHRPVDWQDVQQRSGYPMALAEYTSVTGNLRRVAEWDWELADLAVRLNGPTALALHGLDYLDYGDLGCLHHEQLGDRSRTFVAELEARLGVPVRYLFTGPDGAQLIDRGGVSAPAATPLIGGSGR